MRKEYELMKESCGRLRKTLVLGVSRKGLAYYDHQGFRIQHILVRLRIGVEIEQEIPIP